MGLGVRQGGITPTSVTFVAFSESSNNDVVITLSPLKAKGTISMTKVGADHTMVSPPPNGLNYVGYAGSVTVNNLKPFTQYTYIATNGTDTTTGSFYTVPNRYDKVKFSIAFTTCLQPSNDDDSIFHYLNWYRKNEAEYPLIAHIHPDDIVYADTRSSYTDGQRSYDSNAPQTTGGVGINELSEYNYSLLYGAWYGVLKATNTATAATEKDYVQEYLGNITFHPQAGDHEYQNNTWNIANLTTVKSGLHESGADYNGVGRRAWNNFMKPLMGEQLAVANTNSYHWSLTIGGIQIIAPDCVSNTASTTNSVDDITSALGSDQITEILNAVNNDYPFKLFANPAFCLRYDTTNQFEYKTEQYLASELNRLFLDDGTAGQPYSFMRNPATNGEIGCLVTMRGDSHYEKCFRFTNPASGTNLAESYYELGLMAANGGRGGSSGSAAFADYEPTPTGTDFVGGVGRCGGSHRACVIVKYDNTGDIPKMTVEKIDYNWSDDPIYSTLIDQTYFVEDGIGPDGLYACTFRKIFAPYQGTNLGHDDESDIKPVSNRIRSGNVLAGK